ncbi:hypothetical protein [Oceanisphaera sp. KMM 10153]|uniref:hypothetical protein n=1 Tax=Oceanisphaera submarina TaxID=3390193 RepID=UPI003976AFD8
MNIRIVSAVMALCAFGAQANPPVFSAQCPLELNVNTTPNGEVYLNGKQARVTQFSEDFYEATQGDFSVSIMMADDGSPSVSYTGPNRANGACQVQPSTGTPAPGEPPVVSSAERAGLDQFDANGMLLCSQAAAQPMTQCPFQVARAPGGNATVVVTLPDGRTRAIFFENGVPLSADLSQADGNMTFSASKNGDLHTIKAGNERYEIPDAVVVGG